MRKSLFKKVAATVCAAALTVAMTATCFAASPWTQWIAWEDAGWYEGAKGKVESQSEDGWVLQLDELGWMGVWGAQMKDENISLKPGTEYELKFDMVSSDVDKWVFVKIANDDDDLLWGKWLQLKAGKTMNVAETVTVSEEATKIVFGCGGEMGDRTDEAEMYELLSELPSDVDPLFTTKITMSNYYLGEPVVEEPAEDPEEGGNDEPATTKADGGSGSTTVKTGDFTPIACAAVAVIAASAIVVFTRKREEA